MEGLDCIVDGDAMMIDIVYRTLRVNKPQVPKRHQDDVQCACDGQGVGGVESPLLEGVQQEQVCSDDGGR